METLIYVSHFTLLTDRSTCRIYNMETLIPNHPELQVAIIDFESTDEGRDALIGQTKVDLEDRFLSIKRPICGLTERYMM